MTITCRPYKDEFDYHKIREFLGSTLLLHDRRQVNWPVYRWDYWRWHVNANIYRLRLQDCVFIWETDENSIAAVLNPDRNGEAFLQIHPRFRTPELIRQMLAVAEEKYSTSGGECQSGLRVWAHASDVNLQHTLIERGYARSNTFEYQRWQTLDQPLSNPAVPAGYTLSNLNEDSQLPARSWASWRAFHPGEVNENDTGWEWYRNVQRAPLYRKDLDLMALAPGGDVAAFATIWYDETTRTGAFEPVGTRPEYQHQGLAKALLSEGLRRLHKLGATLAYASSYTPSAHAAYESIGFRRYDLCEMWLKS